MVSLIFWLLLGVGLGMFIVYLIYNIFCIIDGIFSCICDNGSIYGWTIVIAAILFFIFI